MSNRIIAPFRFRILLLLLAAGAAVFWVRKESRPGAIGTLAPAAADASDPSPVRGLDGADTVESAGSHRALFAFARPQEADALSRSLPAPSQEIHYVRLNRALIAGKASPFWQKPGKGRVDVPLPGGGSCAIAIEGSEMLGPDRFTSSGRVEGRPASRAVFAWHAGFLHASIEDPELGRFALRTATADFSQFYRVDPALVPPCGGERRPPRSDLVPPRSMGVATAPPTPLPPVAAAAGNPQRAEVHVLMLYTPAVLPTLTGAARAAALQSAFDLAIAKVNDAFAASQITARVKLVGLAETRYDESRSASFKVQDDALTAIYLEDDGQMDEIHALRDEVGADMVCLALQRSDTASSGLSFLLDVPDDPTNARFAFSIVQYSSMAGTNVVPHEFGHVLGCAHDRENAVSGEGAFSFSYGYRFFGADGRQYHDIMSYPPGVELGYYSNPDVVAPPPVGVALGIPAGRPGESNTALTIERTAFATSAYRLQTQSAPNAGTLINVATRAQVGTGDAVLIGRFVIQGLQPARMLIRAAGPALTPFGVTGALADPVLRVYANGLVAAENDNWMVPQGPGEPATAAEIAAGALQARAFAFPPGSTDAAVLVRLPPGAYSAVVEGAGGLTGSGLVEAYEVGPQDARMINVATRGHAGRDGREMLGGFVVEGVAGATKRILIRVLGPTLSREPFRFDGTLDDPEMELRNAAGELLIRSDDWSTGSEGGVSRENDFKPLVATYGEKRIFATGLAPTNRREPCVLVDLPAGTYTTIVRPYELRSPNPLVDQPAVPGVGVIEVYEIGEWGK